MAMAMAIEDEDYTALLPFGLTSGIIGSFIPECRVSLPTGTLSHHLFRFYIFKF